MNPQRLLAKVLGLNLLAISGTVLISAPFEKVSRQFDDGGFITYFSVIQLFILSYYACKTFKVRSQNVQHPWQSSIAIWGIASLGFSFLALDDLLMIHEWFDKVIHGIGQFEETGMSDRIDDLIVGGYGLIAIGLFVHYRHELKKYLSVLPYVIIGFVLMFLMVAVDALTNRDDLLLMVFSSEVSSSIMSWIIVPEEGLKLLSEAFLIVAAHTCYHMAKRQNTPFSSSGQPNNTVPQPTKAKLSTGPTD